MSARVNLHCGDNRAVLRTMAADSVDAVVCDAPYGLSDEPDMAEVLRHWLAGDDYRHNSTGFMGNSWDSFVPGPVTWKEVFRVLKPGGHLLSFFGTRTYDMGVTAIRLAGFEVRDQIDWIYGSGFPKNLNARRAVDMHVCCLPGRHYATNLPADRRDGDHICPASAKGEAWEGWGTALKPGHEPIVLARKPMLGPVGETLLSSGGGAINIQACRIPAAERRDYGISENAPSRPGNRRTGGDRARASYEADPDGRWPANVIHDGSDDVLAHFPDAPSAGGKPKAQVPSSGVAMGSFIGGGPKVVRNDDGSAARFFYCAKASKRERDAGLTGKEQPVFWFQTGNGASGRPSSMSHARDTALKNNHPTVKPVALMRYLCRLVTPVGGMVLDPFMGSGSTGIACVHEGFDFVGIDLDPKWVDIAGQRIAHAAGASTEAAE